MKHIDLIETTKELILSIKGDEELRKYFLDLDDEQYFLPHPYCYNTQNIKAFVIGADPSNFSNKRHPVILNTVFGIGCGDPRYFRDILNNLKRIGLNLENIYVQNIVRNYMTFETSEKPLLWHKFASLWIEILKQELNCVDPKTEIPALITAEAIYDFLLVDKKEKCSPSDFYNCKAIIPIEKAKNKLERPIIPLYRHFRYKLTSDKWDEYISRLRAILN